VNCHTTHDQNDANDFSDCWYLMQDNNPDDGGNRREQ